VTGARSARTRQPVEARGVQPVERRALWWTACSRQTSMLVGQPMKTRSGPSRRPGRRGRAARRGARSRARAPGPSAGQGRPGVQAATRASPGRRLARACRREAGGPRRPSWGGSNPGRRARGARQRDGRVDGEHVANSRSSAAGAETAEGPARSRRAAPRPGAEPQDQRGKDQRSTRSRPPRADPRAVAASGRQLRAPETSTFGTSGRHGPASVARAHSDLPSRPARGRRPARAARRLRRALLAAGAPGGLPRPSSSHGFHGRDRLGRPDSAC